MPTVKKTEMPKDVSDTTTGFEVPMVYRVCYSCGYSEIVKVKEDGTPSKIKYCPDCGHMLYKLSGTEMFHLNFVNDPEALPANMQVLPPLPTRKLGPVAPLVPPSDIVHVKAEGRVYTYTGENIKERVESRLAKENFKGAKSVLRHSKLVAVDYLPVVRLGVFGHSDGELIEKVLTYKPVTLEELRKHKISYLNENNHQLNIQIDDQVIGFVPKADFPYFTKQVAPTQFEDFIRQAKNLQKDPARLVAFAMSNGVPVQQESVKPSEFPVRVQPSNIRTFKLMASVMNKKGIFWRGDYNSMQVKGSKTQIESVVQKIDPYAVLTEETCSADVNPGFVVKDKKKKAKKWISKFLGGKVTTVETNDHGNLTFRWLRKENDVCKTKLSYFMEVLGDLQAKVEWKNGYEYTSGLNLNQLYLPEMADEELPPMEGEDMDMDADMEFTGEEEGFPMEGEFEAYFPEDISDEMLEKLTAEYDYVQGLAPEFAEIFDVEETEVSDKVSAFLDLFRSTVEAKQEDDETWELTEDTFTEVIESLKDEEVDEVQFIQYLQDREVPNYVTLFILSDVYSIPCELVQPLYDEFVGFTEESEDETEEEPEVTEPEIEEPEVEDETE